MAHLARSRLASQLPRVFNPITRRTITTRTSHHLTQSIVQRTASSSRIDIVGSVSRRYFAVFTEKVPPLGDSISEGTVVSWQKPVGSWVEVDDVLLVIETDKVSVDFRATKSGVLKEQLVTEGATVKVGGDLAKIDPDAPKPAGGAPAAKAAPAAAAPAAPKAAATPAAPATPAPTAAPSTPAPAAKPAAAAAPRSAAPTPVPGSRGERRVAMSRMRQTIAKRLKESQNTAALLTTFNEVDMTQIMELRNRYKDEFSEKHGTKLGFMSAFVKASARALQKFPDVNAVIDGTDTVYRDYVDVSVAVATPTGLVVPVLRNVENMSFAGIESAIAALGAKARKGAITIEDMVGGTFTISNGGVYGSLMGTPIVNQPQSAILGMHGIFKRPVAVNDKVEIRPMMYIALTYDHRIIDGATAVQFLKEIKNNIEDPARLLLEL